jgi:hypothetical protein
LNLKCKIYEGFEEIKKTEKEKEEKREKKIKRGLGYPSAQNREKSPRPIPEFLEPVPFSFLFPYDRWSPPVSTFISGCYFSTGNRRLALLSRHHRALIGQS